MKENENLKSKIRNKPVLSFLILTFTISWIIWTLAPIVTGTGGIDQTEKSSGDIIVLSLISTIGAFGPSLASIIVASILNPLPSNASSKKRWTVFMIIFGISLSYYSSQLFLTNNFRYQMVLLSISISAIAAYVVSSIYHPKQGVNQLMQSLKQISAKNVWLWLAFLLPFAAIIFAATIDLGLGGTGLLSFTFDNLILLVISYPIVLLFGGPLNEEAGWRGFAVPHLQDRFSPLKTGIIVGLIWTFWHFPLHLIGFYPGGVVLFPLRFIYNVPLGVVFTWFFNRSKRNLFVCILLHTSVNLASGIFGATSQLFSYIIIIGFTIAVVFSDKMFKKTKNLQPIQND